MLPVSIREKSKPNKFIWIELVKAIALVWIFANHTAEQLFGYPMIANPIQGWPPLAERIAQLYPLAGYGLWNLPVNLFRYLGWTGDQGVQLFIIVSGFGLTTGLLTRQSGKPLQVLEFYKRRAERIFPLWWAAHLLFIFLWLLTGWGLSLFNPATYLSMIGIRITPGLLYYFSPAWWYIWLLIQLYLVYPLLWEALRRIGPLKLLLWSSVIAFAIRGVGLYSFDGYLDAWARGAIFITRLPEFVFGISFAAWMYSASEQIRKQLISLRGLSLSIIVYLTGLILSITLPGMIIAPFLLGVGIFIFLYIILNKLIPILPHWALAPGLWLGDHTYSIYLVHHTFILALVSSGMAISFQTTGRIFLAVILTLVTALFLEGLVGFLTSLIGKLGVRRSILLAVSIGTLLILLLIGSELLVRRLSPQEVLGWGERASLESDPEFGWLLKPSTTTRLRWSSYDYTVESNSLGFPGPEYAVEKDAGTFRVLVTGDAFTSAEGVDTEQAWPRLLEAELDSRVENTKIEVLNFAMTGYGPNQYAAVIEKFAPIYQPDLIIIQTFVNDFQDVLLSDEDFQASIGFHQPDPSGIFSILCLDHLRKWVQLNVLEQAKEMLRSQPNMEGYFLGNFFSLERDNLDNDIEANDLVAQDMQIIKELSDKLGAGLYLVMAPASVQVCDPSELAYYPENVDLRDATIYDLDKPQRNMAEIAGSSDIPFFDLRKPLKASNHCIYQPHNMHWTTTGHQMVSRYLADLIMSQGDIP